MKLQGEKVRAVRCTSGLNNKILLDKYASVSSLIILQERPIERETAKKKKSWHIVAEPRKS
jgi:hypothetical protein